MRDDLWPSKITDELKILVENGLSSAKIAKILNKSRNSIIGKCNREGFQLKGKSFYIPKSKKNINPNRRKSIHREAYNEFE